jgi:TadE-like protein
MAFLRLRIACPEAAFAGIRSRLARADGQALVEFALVLPLIAALVLAVLDFGRAFNYQNDLTSLANQAARFAEVDTCAPCGAQSIQNYVQSTADSGELRHGGGGTIGIAPPGACINLSTPTTGKMGQPIKATASAKFRWLPFFHFGETTISSTVTGRMETDYTLPVGNSSNCP